MPPRRNELSGGCKIFWSAFPRAPTGLAVCAFSSLAMFPLMSAFTGAKAVEPSLSTNFKIVLWPNQEEAALRMKQAAARNQRRGKLMTSKAKQGTLFPPPFLGPPPLFKQRTGRPLKTALC